MKASNFVAASLIALSIAVFGSCGVTSQVSKFTSSDIELGMNRSEFVGKYGKPNNQEMSYTPKGDKEEVLYYKESLYNGGLWYSVTTAFVFVDSRLVRQEIVNEERISADCDDHKK